MHSLITLPRLLVVAAGIASLSAARADWVIVEKFSSGDQEKQMTITIKGNNVRNDMGDAMTVLFNAEDGSAQMFMHATKNSIKLDSAKLKLAAEMSAKLNGGDTTAPAKPVATGEKVKIGEWETEVYTWEGKMGSAKYYVAKDFPHFAELAKVMDKASKAMTNPTMNQFPRPTDLPGMIVKTELKNRGRDSTTQLVSATEQEVSADLFKAPEGYTERKMPTIPGSAPKRPQ